MKNSGVDWLGNIPVHWNVATLKRIAEIQTGITLGKAYEGRLIERPFLRVGNVQDGRFDLEDVSLIEVPPAVAAGTELRAGDVLMTEGGDLDKLGRGYVWNGEIPNCLHQNHIFAVRCFAHKLHPMFLAYATASQYGRDYFEATGKRTTNLACTNATKVGEFPIPLPSMREQDEILAFLDRKLAAIDAAVAAKRRQLDSLDQMADSFIHRAVTHGLNADIAMRPSEIDWLPVVPHHWQVRQIKRRCALLRGKFTHRPRNDPAFYDGEYPFVQTGDITSAEKYIRTYSQTLNELGFSVSKMFPKGTLCMSIAANVGDVAILDFEACFPDSMVGLVPDHHTKLDFLYYLMRAMKGILLRSAVQTTQLNLNYVRIGTNFAPFPPAREQEEIARYLDGKLADVKRIANGIEAQIATLIAYRKSLIHECVTGQRRITGDDLREIAARGGIVDQEHSITELAHA